MHLHWRICVFHTCLPSCTRVLKRANQYDKVRCSFGVILNSLLAEKCKALQQHRSNARLREGILKTEGTMRLSRTLGAGRARFSTDTPHKTCTESGESNNSTIIHPRTATNRYIYIFCRLLGSRGLVSRCSSWKNETPHNTHQGGRRAGRSLPFGRRTTVVVVVIDCALQKLQGMCSRSRTGVPAYRYA